MAPPQGFELVHTGRDQNSIHRLGYYCTMRIEALFTAFSTPLSRLIQTLRPTYFIVSKTAETWEGLCNTTQPTALNNSCALTTPQTALLSFWQHLTADPHPRVQEGFAPTKM